MTRRSRAKVIVDILTEASGGANKTRIMYRANLNLLRFNRYLSELLEKGLLEEDHAHGRVVYRVTSSGKDLLSALQRAQEFISV
jgi:predicted transcriptional regulator